MLLIQHIFSPVSKLPLLHEAQGVNADCLRDLEATKIRRCSCSDISSALEGDEI